MPYRENGLAAESLRVKLLMRVLILSLAGFSSGRAGIADTTRAARVSDSGSVERCMRLSAPLSQGRGSGSAPESPSRIIPRSRPVVSSRQHLVARHYLI